MANASMPWVKLFLDMLDDPKVGKLSRSTRLRFVELLLIAGECDADGGLINGDMPMTIEDIAWRLRADTHDVFTEMAELRGAGLISSDGGVICVTNFSKRQGRSQSDKRAAWRERKARQKENDPKGDDGFTRDSRVNHAPRGEERREEEEKNRGEERKNATFPPPPSADIADSTGQVIASEEVRNSEPVLMWRRKVRRPLTPEASNYIFANVTDLEKWGAVLDCWLVNGYKEENVMGQVSMYSTWDTDRRNPKNQRQQPATNGKPAPISYFGEGGVLDQAMNAVWGDMGVNNGN